MTPAYVDPEYVFTYIRYGEGVFLLEDSRHKLRAGDCVLLPPYMLHIINTGGDAPLGQYVLHFDLFERPERSGPLEKDRSMRFSKFRLDAENPESCFCDAPRISRPSSDARRRIERLIIELKDEFEGSSQWRSLAIKSRMLEILRLHFIASAETGPCQGDSSSNRPQVWRNLERAIKFIHENYAEDIGLERMAKAAGLSPNYFCQLFMEYTGCPPRTYLNTLRVKEAKRLIDEGRLNFTQVAGRCGFGSIHVFSKVFRRVEGMAPSSYKAGL